MAVPLIQRMARAHLGAHVLWSIVHLYARDYYSRTVIQNQLTTDQFWGPLTASEWNHFAALLDRVDSGAITADDIHAFVIAAQEGTLPENQLENFLLGN